MYIYIYIYIYIQTHIHTAFPCAFLLFSGLEASAGASGGGGGAARERLRAVDARAHRVRREQAGEIENKKNEQALVLPF